MNEINNYLNQILQKYQPKNISGYANSFAQLKSLLRTWASGYCAGIIDIGSRAKGTAISLASDFDILISLTNNCNPNNGGLKAIYDSLYDYLKAEYHSVRKQNVSIRVLLPNDWLGTSNPLEVDVTPGRLYLSNSGHHSIYLSKLSTWQQTNPQQHVSEVSYSGITGEIKLLKIWRELNQLDFPSVYLEYLLIKNILSYKPKGYENLGENFRHIIQELAKDCANPLYSNIEDPANSNNKLAELLKPSEKQKIINFAKIALQKNWNQVLY